MTQATVLYGNGPQDIAVQQEQLNVQDSAVSVDTSDTMFQFRETGYINGIPAQDRAKNLMVDNAAQLLQALQLVRTVHIFMQWLSPDTQQKLEQYRQIQQKAASGSVIIVQQSKQYDPAKNAYLFFIKYQQLTYKVSTRYQYLLQ